MTEYDSGIGVTQHIVNGAGALFIGHYHTDNKRAPGTFTFLHIIIGLEMVSEDKELSEAESKRVLGEALPSGLKLID